MMRTDHVIQMENGRTMVRSTLFNTIPHIDHCFIGRSDSAEEISGIPQDTTDRGRNESPLAVPLRQVHGGEVLTLNEERPRGLPDVDGVVTTFPNRLLTVRVADCMPIFLADREGRSIGLLHAGWRGVAAGIIGAGLRALRATGASPERLAVWIGPSIGPCCYEVGPEVTEQIGRFAVFTPGPDDRRMLDLYGTARAILESEGVPAETIVSGPPCTCCDPTHFHSHRGSGGEAGRNRALLMLRPAESAS